MGVCELIYAEEGIHWFSTQDRVASFTCLVLPSMVGSCRMIVESWLLGRNWPRLNYRKNWGGNPKKEKKKRNTAWVGHQSFGGHQVHTLTPRGNLHQAVHLMACFWEVGGTQKKPSRTRKETQHKL